ncbi:MAG TPA: hypothetical protein VG389_10765 [Myxococcota bacterium]|jgi:hypothetical protein|nr:hypothetical protein [Myxococcota bacterium]
MRELRRFTNVVCLAGGAALTFALALGSASCFNPDIPSNSFRCADSDPEPRCPAGQDCVSGWCVNPGDSPATDGGGNPGTDADTGVPGDGGVTCGDNVHEGTEACDGSDLNGESCTTMGLGVGTLVCAGDCTFDTTGCTTCGNTTIDAAEDCDGSATPPVDPLDDCTTIGMGFVGGTLGCSATCTFDTSLCTAPPGCGTDMIISGTEDCDNSATPPIPVAEDCMTQASLPDGVLACTAGCVFDTTDCHDCGNNALEGSEVCDGTDLGTSNCDNETAGSFPDGTLGCSATCTYTTTSCHNCGNNAIEGGETCDGTDLGGADCAGQGFMGGGALACNGTCTAFDTAGCFQCDADPDCTGTPATPVCDIPNHVCVECNGDPDCSGTPATPACDTGTHTCALCFGSSLALCGGMETCSSNECTCSATMSATGEACDDASVAPDCVAGVGCRCEASLCGAGETCSGPGGDCECAGVPAATGEACDDASANPNCLGSGCACDADSTCDTDEGCSAGACTCGTTAPTMGRACGAGGPAACNGTFCVCNGTLCTAGQTCNAAGMACQ